MFVTGLATFSNADDKITIWYPRNNNCLIFLQEIKRMQINWKRENVFEIVVAIN